MGYQSLPTYIYLGIDMLSFYHKEIHAEIMLSINRHFARHMIQFRRDSSRIELWNHRFKPTDPVPVPTRRF